MAKLTNDSNNQTYIPSTDDPQFITILITISRDIDKRGKGSTHNSRGHTTHFCLRET